MLKSKNIQGFLIVATVAITVSVFFQYLLNRFLDTMLISKLEPFIKKWEGGLSRDSKDSAAQYPAPWTYKGVTGWHTNKGITYQTFVSNANKLGYAPTADIFFNMPNEIWMKILKEAYVKAFPLNKIAHLPRIQAVVITWAWGSGATGAKNRLTTFQRQQMGVTASSLTPAQIIDNFKKQIKPINERDWFLKLCDHREADFKRMPSCSAHCTGWLRRLEDFKQRFA